MPSRSRSRQIIEAVVGPSPEEVEHIMDLANGSRNWQEANEKIKPYGVAFSNHSMLASTGAIGGYDPESGMVLLNAKYFPMPAKYLRIALEHELVHRDQMSRAVKRGADPAKIVHSKLQRYLKGDWKSYKQDPLEMQALAYNAVASARRSDEDPRALLRRGYLRQHAPLPPGDRKRFGKYAYQITQ
jgi:hypothetical protein